MDIAILDTSAAAHMTDVLEIPYRPEITGAGRPGEHAFTYRHGGLTCLTGDVIGDYSFRVPLDVCTILIFEDMALKGRLIFFHKMIILLLPDPTTAVSKKWSDHR